MCIITQIIKHQVISYSLNKYSGSFILNILQINNADTLGSKIVLVSYFPWKEGSTQSLTVITKIMMTGK